MPAAKTRTIKVTKTDKGGLQELTVEELKDLFQDFIPGDIMDSVTLPPGEDLNEWLAVNVYEFFESIQLIYSTCEKVCNEKAITCVEMNAGENCKYLWQDGRVYKKPTPVTAPMYITLLFQWVQGQLEDEAIFPTSPTTPLPKEFPKIVRNIFRRLFRVYAHIFMCHYGTLVEKNIAQTFNTCLKHFLLFVREFQLIEANELEPLRIILDKI
ncbi:Mob1-like protein [Giardia duodenalis]|uniref:Mob1-like protein n=2 Tax=Giardia intestinalis TaxID=5741 RepID=A8B2T9_GIAIC|nr:Mob1-like protein [Giardia intestinalis]ESU39565.1 Maintenance of ploidy protein MOB1 [Giardia intestinalis]KAE8303044.1 Mob1-like protein [Giardia intestinalis]|eukprot:XP_001710048.1 Mob1-like protein [Giardia lamblia ATCC 50803]